jgi:lactoylglutathione lyase
MKTYWSSRSLALCALALGFAGCDQGPASSDPYRPQDEQVLEQTVAVDAATPPALPVLGAVGIGVSDLAKSTDFYTRVLGMKQTATYKLSMMDEVVVAYDSPRGSSIVLMHYTDGRTINYKDLPVKLVVYVADAKALFEKIRAEKLVITREPAPLAVLNNAVVGIAKDPDGYELEVIQR